MDGSPKEILDVGPDGLIQRPFSIATFADKLKEILEEK